jgi:hypothetical protein
MATNPHEQARRHNESPTLPLPPPELPPEIQARRHLESPTLPLPPPEPPPEIQAESATVEKGQPAPHIALPTREDIAKNNLQLKPLPSNLGGIDAFLPELRKKKPMEVLQILQDRYSAEPNPANSSLLQYAVNRITTAGPVDAQIRDAIAQAVEVLHGPRNRGPRSRGSHRGGEPPGAGSTDDLFCWAYVDADYGGASMFLDLSPGWIYWAESYVGDAMNDQISSLICSCTSDEVAGNFCLFENADFIGRYQNYAVTVPPGIDGWVEEDVSYVGNDFNDITSSILLIRRFPDETSPVSIGGLVPQSDITNIVNAQSQVSSAGDATFTWDMWPTGGSHPDDPEKRFLYVLVPVNIDTQTIFGTYSAQIRYWIYLYVDSNGKLQGYVDWYGCWVQGGWITGRVQNSLMQRIPGTIGQVNNLVSKALALANIGGPYRFCYFLPGKNVFTGSTWDDVTIVCVK